MILAYFIAIMNIAIVFFLAIKETYEIVAFALLAAGLLVMFLGPLGSIGNFLIIYFLKVEAGSVRKMNYEIKVLYLSLVIYVVASKIIGIIGGIIAFVAIGIVAIAIWLALGWWWDGSIIQMLDAAAIAKYSIKIYQFISSIGEMIVKLIVEMEISVLKIEL